MNKLYVLLSRTDTVPARLIRSATKDEYSHASLGFDRGLTRLYSFARRKEHFPLIAGFVTENVHSGVYSWYPEAPCILYELSVSDETYKAAENRIAEMNSEYKKYKYNFWGMLCCALNKPNDRKYKYVCSEFVADTLERTGACTLPKHPSLMHPMDFYGLPSLTEVYRGPLKNVTAV